MRLEPAEVPRLPLAAALLDGDGRPVAVTPEWRGAGPGARVYLTGHGHLVVAPDVPTPELDGLVDCLLAALEQARGDLDSEAAMRVEVLTSGLRLVAGRPPGDRVPAGAGRVLELARAAIAARTQGLAVEVAEPPPAIAVPCPGALALAVTQLAVNAQQHEEVAAVSLRVAPGPTFYVEWTAQRSGPAGIQSHRHPLRRQRWGWAYVQMVADALGAAALPPGPTRPGVTGACLGLGSVQLTLPLARVAGGRVDRSTLAWDQDPDVPRFGSPLTGAVAELVSAARQRPGEVVYFDLYRSRHSGDHTWLALAPEAGSNRARDLLRGLAHERSLWTAPEPHATRLHALVGLLGVALGDPWPTVPPSVWSSLAPAAAAALGVSLPAQLDTVAPPDPRLLALLLAELRGGLAQEGDRIYVLPSPSAADLPLARALSHDPAGRVGVNL